jgi:parvulin-like peptidyl-prolyl isomerase
MTIKKNDEARIQGLKDEKAWRKIQDLRERIVKGEDFAKLAKEFSQDSHAEKEGLGDWLEPGSMIPEIDNVLFKMKPGEISDVIETTIGYHFFRVEERQEEKQRSLDDVRELIFAKLFEEKSLKRFNEWMDELKRTSYISMR